jgi:hypothetical protein
MKLFNPYYYTWYSYFISPYLFISPIPNIKENKLIVFLPFPTVIHARNIPDYNISETQIQEFIHRIKKHEFLKKKNIPLEDY